MQNLGFVRMYAPALSVRKNDDIFLNRLVGNLYAGHICKQNGLHRSPFYIRTVSYLADS